MEPTETDRAHCYSRETTMRYATVVVDPGTDGFYPESRVFLDRANVTRERVHHVELLEDGTVVGLYELHGDADRIRSGVRYLPHVVSFDVVGTDPVFLYLHEEATEPARTLLRELEAARTLLYRPFEHRPDGSLRLTVIGEEGALRRTLRSLDDTFDLRLEETGDYRPDLRDLEGLLTERQRQILWLAVDLGYYDVPRGTTHDEIAAHAELSQSTVAEHLQKIEARILPHVSQQAPR